MFSVTSLIRYCRSCCHRKGHGVHSPFAYRLIKDVVAGKGHYYSERRLTRLTEGFPKALKREYAMLFRLVARLSPEAVRISDIIEPQMELLIRLADTRPFMARGMGGYGHKNRVMTICSATDLRTHLPEGLLSDGNILFVRELKSQPEVRHILQNEMAGGWIFVDSNSLLLVSNDSEPLNEIDVKLT